VHGGGEFERGEGVSEFEYIGFSSEHGMFEDV
jgi:hypothetical protein